MQIQENISLKKYNTFGIDVSAKYFARFSSVEELAGLLDIENRKAKDDIFILGGGSNVLFTRYFNGLVLKNEIPGIRTVKEDEHHVYVQAGAGENWHQFVLYCIDHQLAGVENLSLIPGSVGASPMQNIGAYGVEIKDVFYSLEAFHRREKKIYHFNLNDCQFGYRESIFKHRLKDEFIITSVTYRLSKKPQYNISYGAIEQELQKMGIQKLSIKIISDAVINIRSAKLPDPEKIGNAGSFFKNPQIDNEKLFSLQSRFPDIVYYSLPGNAIKLAAGWLIEQCGWKGYRIGDAGCHEKQALVLVNYGHAAGTAIHALSKTIFESVKEKFGIELQTEVNIV